jgi:hypothetical protein
MYFSPLLLSLAMADTTAAFLFYYPTIPVAR